MFCPNCKAEFREGFTYCQKCGFDLVEDLPPSEESIQKPNSIISKLLTLKIEDWLKYGGIVFIIVAVIKEGSNHIFPVIQNVSLQSLKGFRLFGVIVTIIYSIIKDALWGLFYIALGHIIGFLKKDDDHNAENN